RVRGSRKSDFTRPCCTGRRRRAVPPPGPYARRADRARASEAEGRHRDSLVAPSYPAPPRARGQGADQRDRGEARARTKEQAAAVAPLRAGDLGADGAVAAEETRAGLRVGRARLRVEVGTRAGLRVEVAVPVVAAHQGRGEAARTDVPHARGDVADADADAPVS